MRSHTSAIQNRLWTTGSLLSAVLPATSRVKPWHVAMATFSVSIGNYILGDLFVKPRYGQTAAAVAAGANAGLLTLATSRLLPGMRVGPLGFVATAGSVGLSQWFSDTYLENKRYTIPKVGRLAEELGDVIPLGSDNGKPRPHRAIPVRRPPE